MNIDIAICISKQRANSYMHLLHGISFSETYTGFHIPIIHSLLKAGKNTSNII